MDSSPFFQIVDDNSRQEARRTSDISVGPAALSDAGPISALLTAIMEQHGLAPTPEQVGKAIADVFAHPEWAEFLVARRNGSVIGMLTLVRSYSTWAASPYATVDDFIVAPAERNSGVGLALMRAAVARARELGYARLELNVEEDNERARRFYEEFGFAKQTRFLYSYALK